MRYTREGSDDWVELAGCADMPMRDLDSIYTADMEVAREIAKEVVQDWSLTARGKPVALKDMRGMTVKQWLWLRKSIIKSATDEALDPEA